MIARGSNRSNLQLILFNEVNILFLHDLIH